MPTYENMYYYLEHSIREALQDLEQQNFGAAKKTLTQAREVTEKMRRVIVGKNDVYECFRNPFVIKKRRLTASLFVCTFYAFFARSQRAVNATASLIAISLSILRLISMPLTFRPCMKVE